MKAVFTVDGINDADVRARIKWKVSVGKSSRCARRECPAEETGLAWVAMKAYWRWLARAFTGTVMTTQSNGNGLCRNGHSGLRGARAEDIAQLRSLAWRSMAAFALRDLSVAVRALDSAYSATADVCVRVATSDEVDVSAEPHSSSVAMAAATCAWSWTS